MTSTGPPTSPSSAELPDRSPDARPGARRPPVSRVPEGTRRLAPTCRLAGGCTTHGLLGRSSLGCLLRRSPLLDGLACRSPLGCLLRRSPLLCSLPCRSPLHGLPCRSPLDGLFGCRALGCLLCGGPLFRGLLGRGPSFCGYCHRCTSLGAWSLNRGEACATSRSIAPRRAHCRTDFTCNCVGCRRCAGVMNATASRHTDVIPHRAISR